MIRQQLFKDSRDLRFAVLCEHTIDRREMFHLCIAGLIAIHIEHKRFEQVPFAVVPEVIALP